MARKLKVELDVETSKAKSKVKKDLGGSVATGEGASRAGGTSASAERLERAMNRAAKGAEDFGKESAKTGVNLSNAFKSLAGFGAGMAVNWAANFMQEGKSRDYVEKAGSAMQGASMGAAVGDALGDLEIMGIKAKKLTTLAGAVAGYAGKNAEQEKAKTTQLESIADTRKQFSQVQEWRDKMRELTEMPAHFGDAKDVELLKKQLEAVQEQSRKAAEEIEKLVKKENALHDASKKAAEESKLEESAKKQQEMQKVQAQIMQVEAAKHNADRQASSIQNQIDNFLEKATPRASTTATDALGRIGGNISGKEIAPSADNTAEAKADTSNPTAPGNIGFNIAFANAIGKFMAKEEPKKSEGTYFLQDKNANEEIIDKYLLEEDEKQTKLLEEIVNISKNANRGAIW